MSDGQFLAYTCFLAISGILMLVVALLPIFGGTTASRVIGALIGVAFLGYAFYLHFIFAGGTVEVFYYVFIVPFLYIVRGVKGFAARRDARDAQNAQQFPGNF